MGVRSARNRSKVVIPGPGRDCAAIIGLQHRAGAAAEWQRGGYQSSSGEVRTDANHPQKVTESVPFHPATHFSPIFAALDLSRAGC